MHRVLLAARVRIYRDGIANALTRDGGFRVIAEATTGAEAVGLSRSEAPELVLVDTSLPGSLPTVAAIAALSPAPLIVTLGLPESESEVLAFAEAGASGFVGTEDDAERLLEVLHSVMRGELLCSPRTAALMLRHVASLRRAPRGPGLALTFREREIVALISYGLSNKQIAARLNIELPTVKNHVHRILEKLQVHRRAEVRRRLEEDVTAGSATTTPEWVGPTPAPQLR